MTNKNIKYIKNNTQDTEDDTLYTEDTEDTEDTENTEDTKDTYLNKLQNDIEEQLSSDINPVSSTTEFVKEFKEFRKNVQDYLEKSKPIINAYDSVKCFVAKKLFESLCKNQNFLNNPSISDLIKTGGSPSIKSSFVNNNNKYKQIVNPISGRKVNIHSKLGKKIIKKYLNISFKIE